MPLIEDPDDPGYLIAVSDYSPPQGEGWHTLDSARDQWKDAPANDDTLGTLLESALDQCVAFAPAHQQNTPVPARYRQAQLMQARALWQSTKSNSSGEIGEGGFAVQVFPMDWTVKSLLRPRRGIPVIV